MSKPSISTSPSVSPISSASGNLYENAAILESLFNILGGTTMILFPTYCLSWMSNTTPAPAVSMTQWLGALTLGLTPQLLLSLRKSRTAFESRPMAYITLLAGEGCLVPMMMWQASKKGSGTGLTPQALTVACVVLGSTAVWRLILLFGRPDWFGKYVDEQEKQKEG